MSNYRVSDVDDLDDLTYGMLDSRFCRLSGHVPRQERPRPQREREPGDFIAHREKRRPRVHHAL